MLLIYLWCILLNLGAAAINQVEVFWRFIIFLVLLGLSAAFAFRLHLFEPVLRHHYNPKTKKDEIVTPDDEAFADEDRLPFVDVELFGQLRVCAGGHIPSRAEVLTTMP